MLILRHNESTEGQNMFYSNVKFQSFHDVTLK